MSEIEYKEFSSLTSRGYRHRTTVPKRIYDKLQLKDKDVLCWILHKDGNLTVEKV